MTKILDIKKFILIKLKLGKLEIKFNNNQLIRWDVLIKHVFQYNKILITINLLNLKREQDKNKIFL